MCISGSYTEYQEISQALQGTPKGSQGCFKGVPRSFRGYREVSGAFKLVAGLLLTSSETLSETL